MYEPQDLELFKEPLSEEVLQEPVKPQIKTIVFDFGGVLFTDGSLVAIKKIQRAFKLKECDTEDIMDCFSNEPGAIGNLIRLGKISLEEFEDGFAERLGLTDSQKRTLRHHWFSSYVPNYLMKKVVKKLAKDYNLIAFSGNVRERIEYLRKRFRKMFKYFDDEVYSFDYGQQKRNIEFYEILLDHLDCKPEEALLIDDSPRNIRIARSIGMHGIRYSYTEQFLDELKDYGIELDL